MTAPRLVIGMALYGGGEYLQEALESLLAQTYGRLAIVLTDDRPSEEVAAIVARLPTSIVSYVANQRRLGLVGNWRRAFAVAADRHPDAPYFAWASDHDAWHPYWAERLVCALDEHPQAVAAYSQTYRMTREGRTMSTRHWRFATDAPDPAERLRAAVRGMSAGNMVYGVFRVQSLQRAGIMRKVLLPDRLLLTELSLAGDLHQVGERLFYRRVTEAPTIARQRAAFWPDGLPLYARLPWSLQHVGSMWWTLVLRRGGPPQLEPPARLRIAGVHAFATSRYALGRLGGRAYVKAVGGRSMKRELARALGRLVEALQNRRLGEPVLTLGRGTLERLGRR